MPRSSTCAPPLAPDNPWLAWALYLAHATAEARGWAATAPGDAAHTGQTAG